MLFVMTCVMILQNRLDGKVHSIAMAYLKLLDLLFIGWHPQNPFYHVRVFVLELFHTNRQIIFYVYASPFINL